MTKRVLAAWLRIGVAAIVALSAHAACAAEFANDGYTAGGSAAFQTGLAAGEIAAVRLAGAPCPARVHKLRFLFGGSGTTRDAIIHIWEDSGGTLAPGAELFSTAFTIAPLDTTFQELNLDGFGVDVCGAFRVGIEFTAAGAPSVARDTDGTVDAGRNFVFAQGLGWVASPALGIAGDWVIRADAGVAPPPADELRNDGYSAGSSAAFQGSFVAGEIAAVRLVPESAPTSIEGLRLLFGTQPGNRDVVVHIWDDAAGTLAPGAELFSGVFNLVSSQVLIDIDLSSASIVATGPFRVGIESTADGLPSVARDTDGTIDESRNFVLANGIGWAASNTLGLTGDWVIRALIPEPDAAVLAAASFAALAGLARSRASLR
jgi:hypothetical protein